MSIFFLPVFCGLFQSPLFFLDQNCQRLYNYVGLLKNQEMVLLSSPFSLFAYIIIFCFLIFSIQIVFFSSSNLLYCVLRALFQALFIGYPFLTPLSFLLPTVEAKIARYTISQIVLELGMAMSSRCKRKSSTGTLGKIFSHCSLKQRNAHQLFLSN